MILAAEDIGRTASAQAVAAPGCKLTVAELIDRSGALDPMAEAGRADTPVAQP